jgi:glycosyltransferase involved in cell wall biosynthesis
MTSPFNSIKIAVLTSDPQSIFWHRFDLVQAFSTISNDVLIISGGNSDWAKKFNKHKLRHIPIRLARNGLNPLTDLMTCLDFIKILRQEKPNKIFVYQAKAVVYGCWAAHLCGIKEVYTMLSGLGSVLRTSNHGVKQQILCLLLRLLYKNAFKYSKIVFFQNADDRQIMLDNKCLPFEKTYLINGSGVDINNYYPCRLPSIPTFLYIGRLVRDKGVGEYLEACKKIKAKYENIRCLLVGPFDTNPSSLDTSDLKPYIDTEIIEYMGEQEDVRPFISQCSTYILPSYHEGTPRSVLQAMAMERAIITTDAPGCRETVRNGDNGFLVPVKDVDAIVERMEILINNPELNAQMGKKSRIIAVEKYDVRLINQLILKKMNLEYN